LINDKKLNIPCGKGRITMTVRKMKKLKKKIAERHEDKPEKNEAEKKTVETKSEHT
jgi:hypothetical protein